MTKTWITWMLLASLMGSTISPAASASSAAPRLDRILSGLKNQNRLTLPHEAARTKVKETGGSLFETFLFITTLAVIDATARDAKKEGLHSLSPAKLSELTLKSAHAVLDMPQIPAGMVGASIAMAGAKAPATAFQMIVKTPAIKNAFVPVLARAAASTITFLGWEFGSQLWTEASLLLNDSDYKTASSFLGMSSGVALTLADAGSASDKDRARVAKLMVQNMVRVLFLDSELRAEWMNNTWRLHVMTGDFATLLAAMVTAGEIGSKYGKLRGFFAGVTLGALTLAIPQGPKSAVTGVFQSMRARVLQARLDENTETLLTIANQPSRFRTILSNRRGFRESLATISWEKIHRALATSDRSLFATEISDLLALYSNELTTLLRLTNSAGASKRLIQSEISNVSALKDFATLLRDGGAALAGDYDFRQIAEANNARGFSEAPTIEQTRASN